MYGNINKFNDGDNKHFKQKIMKYITTDKHSELKKGLIFEAEYPAYFVVWHNRDIETDLKHGYIKEVQEKEFTRGDMIAFTYWCVSNGYDTSPNRYKGFLDNWLKQRK